MAEYIEREALIEKCKAIIQDKWNDKSAPVSWSHAYADFIEDIENQPAADVAPVRHGYWIECKYGLTFECSECKYTTEYNLTNFCPNCGAKLCRGE